LVFSGKNLPVFTPEPGTWAMLLIGMAFVALSMRAR
jgi:PEP-CTERM motif